MAINFRPVGAVNKEVLQEPSFLQDLGADIKQTFKGVKNVAQETLQKQTQAFGTSQPLASKLTQSIGIGAGGVSNIFGEVLKGGVKAVLPQQQEQQLKSGVQSAVAPIVQSQPVQNLISKYQSLDENTKRNVDSLLGIGSFVADITGLGIGAKGVSKGAQVGMEAGKEALEAVVPAVTRATQKLKEVAKREVTPETALKETLQAKPMTEAQLKSGIDTIKQLDTTKVKTFQDLDNVITDRIGNLAKQVDDELGKDATKYQLTDLVTTKKTKAGTPIQINFVDDALNQLDELYGATGDVVAQQDIKDLINTAKTQGLTRLEVNDIARTYGKEVGDKAFNKMGEPLTSVNAQRFENTRKGLKEVARQGVEGTAAKQADEAMSRLYNVQRLIKKNAERANALRNKIEERGLLEKVGHAITKYADVLTGGTIRGLIGGLLPRGAGYKTLNALDLEALLERNLKIIQDAGKAKKASEVKATLQKLNEPIKKKFDPTKQGGFVRIGKETPKTALPKSKVNESVSSLNDTTLIKEAKKYKSAEDFVKAQGETLYHGSSVEGASDISKNGFKILNTGNAESGVSLSPNKNISGIFAGNKGQVLETVISQDAKLIPGEKFDAIISDLVRNKKMPYKTKQEQAIVDSLAAKEAKKQGFDGVDWRGQEESFESLSDEIRIWNLDKVKTKSQLTDIWNKANKK